MIVAGIIICVILSAFFSGLETGLIAANQLGIYDRREKGGLGPRCAYFLLRKPERLLGTTLVGNNIAVVTATILFIMVLQRMNLPAWSVGLGVFALTLVFLVFAEVIPKSFFRNHADTISVKLAPLLVVFYVLTIPISWGLNLIIKLFLFILGKGRAESRMPASRDDLFFLIRLRSMELGLPQHDQKLMADIFDFRNTKAREVMIPFHELPLCRRDVGMAELVAFAESNGARFIPVYEQRMDNITGFVDVEDLLFIRSNDFSDIIKEAVFYPETKRIPDLLLNMNRKKQQVVFLSDEYGVISGMITSNEIIADIVGFIPGELNGNVKAVTAAGKNRYLVTGTADIEEFTHETGINVAKGSYDTIGGYICEKLGEIPLPGTVVEDGHIVYKILESDKKRIIQIEVCKKPENL
jgi:putative hemolysin